MIFLAIFIYNMRNDYNYYLLMYPTTTERVANSGASDVLLAVNEVFVLFEVSSSKQYFDFKYYFAEAIK